MWGWHSDEGSLHRAWPRKQFQDRSRDDPERAFCSDEQMTQIVASIVFFELAQIVEDAAVREHHLEPEHQVAGDPIGERARTAGIGGEVAADGAAPFGAERERKQPPCSSRGLLGLDEND